MFCKYASEVCLHHLRYMSDPGTKVRRLVARWSGRTECCINDQTGSRTWTKIYMGYLIPLPRIMFYRHTSMPASPNCSAGITTLLYIELILLPFLLAYSFGDVGRIFDTLWGAVGRVTAFEQEKAWLRYCPPEVWKRWGYTNHSITKSTPVSRLNHSLT